MRSPAHAPADLPAAHLHEGAHSYGLPQRDYQTGLEAPCHAGRFFQGEYEEYLEVLKSEVRFKRSGAVVR